MKIQRHDLHTLTGSYALDAIDGPELEDFERHLSHCQSCTAEVRGLQETAARIGLAAALEPPEAMRERVLAAASRTRQLPPVVTERPRRRRRGWLPTAVAGLAAAAAIALGVVYAVTQHQLDNAQAQNRAIAAVLAAPDARVHTVPSRTGGTVTAVVSIRQRRAVITTSGMPSLPATKVYQLWVISATRARSAGLLPAAEAGRTEPVLASGIRPGDTIGVTVEPAGGTSRHTTTPLALMPLPTA